MLIEKHIYSQSEAFYSVLEEAESVKDLEEIFSMILRYFSEADNKDCFNPLDDAVKKYLHECNFEALTEQREQIGLDIDVDYYV